jgi:hypothetical protein
VLQHCQLWSGRLLVLTQPTIGALLVFWSRKQALNETTFEGCLGHMWRLQHRQPPMATELYWVQHSTAGWDPYVTVTTSEPTR